MNIANRSSGNLPGTLGAKSLIPEQRIYFFFGRSLVATSRPDKGLATEKEPDQGKGIPNKEVLKNLLTAAGIVSYTDRKV